MTGDAFCILPWTHLEVVPEGNAKICCVAREAIREKGQPMNVAQNSLEEIRGSTYMRSVRTALASGQRIPVCQYCWAQEGRGETSQRHLWNKRFSGSVQALQARLGEGADPADPMPLEYIQISVGNKCNLACRMCNASYSSRIEEDPVHVRFAPKQDREGTVAWAEVEGGGFKAAWRRLLAPGKPRRRPNWVEGTPWFEQPEFVEKDMIGAGSTLKLLYVTGGEPLFVPSFDKILDEYVAKGHSQQMAISLNTNLFHNEGRIARAMESLLRFQHCHLAPSIDGFGAPYEYIRYPAKWSIVERNIRSIAEIARQRSNLTFLLTTVFQAYNCFNMVELFRFADDLLLECYPHVLDGPWQLRPHVLSAEMRKKAADGLKAYVASPGDAKSQAANRKHAARIAHYLDLIEETPDLADARRAFVTFTRALDESRGQSLERSVPELAEMMTLFG